MTERGVGVVGVFLWAFVLVALNGLTGSILYYLTGTVNYWIPFILGLTIGSAFLVVLLVLIILAAIDDYLITKHPTTTK